VERKRVDLLALIFLGDGDEPWECFGVEPSEPISPKPCRMFLPIPSILKLDNLIILIKINDNDRVHDFLDAKEADGVFLFLGVGNAVGVVGGGEDLVGEGAGLGEGFGHAVPLGGVLLEAFGVSDRVLEDGIFSP